MSTLAQYHAARAALAAATRVDQVLTVRDELEHVKLYARQVKDRALMADAAALQMRAERELGRLLLAAEQAGQIKTGRPRKAALQNGSSEEPFSRVTLAEVGISKKLSAKAQRAAGLPEEAFEAMVADMCERVRGAGAIIVDPLAAAEKEAERGARREAHRKRSLQGGTVMDLHALAASGFRAKTILADPPWRFLTRSEAGEGRSASQHYRTEDLDAIKALPVAELAAPDSVLLMWIVDWAPHWALELIAALGFEHKTTAFTWMKTNPSGEGWHMGQGYWTRANPEDCWLATRGAPKRMAEDVRQLVIAPVSEHSEKPAEVHDRIERLLEGPYLELFARRERPGWITWGDELEFISPPSSASAAQEQIAANADAPDASGSDSSSDADDQLGLPAFLLRGPDNAPPFAKRS